MVSQFIHVSAMVTSSQSKHKWGGDVLSLDCVIESERDVDLVQSSQASNALIWRELKLQAHALHCEAYYQNLMSGQPKIYLICKREEAGQIAPSFITADYDEANSYSETGEEVLMTDLPESMCYWLEKFVVENYQPEKLKKRRRQKWHNDETKQ